MPAAVETEPLTDAQAELVNDHIGLAYEIAGKSKDRRLDLDDRRQAAVVGLIRAVQGWEPGKGALSTYATYWIRQAIQRAAAKMKPLASIHDLEGFEPVDVTEASDLDADDAERLRAVVASLPDQPRAVIVDRYWRDLRPRGTEKTTEEFALRALRLATGGGRSIPATAPHWRDAATGEMLRPSKLSRDEERALRGLVLLPLFPAAGFGRESECPHDGPTPPGREVCMVCHKSGLDGIVLPRPEDVKPLPIDRPKPPPKPAKAETRKQRRARGKAA